MIKSGYTDEEIKNVFQSLFTEKKKVKELQQHIEQLRQEAISKQSTLVADDVIEENQRLKQLILKLKSDYLQASTAQQQTQDASDAENTLQRQKEHIRILEENNALLSDENNGFLHQLKSLKELLKQAQEENKQTQKEAQATKNSFALLNAKIQAHESSNPPNVTQSENRNISLLQQENQKLYSAITEAQEQIHGQKLRLEKLALTIMDKDKRIQELQQYEFTHKKAAEQRQELQYSQDSIKSENEKLQNELNESRQHGQQLERVIKFLREKSEEGQLASKQFKQDFECSQEVIEKLNRELSQSHEQLQSIRHTTLNLEHENNERNEELKAIQGQLEQLKCALIDTQKEKQQLEIALNQTEQLILKEQENSLNLAEELNQQTLLVENSRKEIDSIKQALIRGMREAREIDLRFKESVQEKVAAISKLHHIRQQLEQQEKEVQILQEELRNAKDHYQRELRNLQQDRFDLEQKKNQEIDALQEEKNQEIDALQREKNEAINALLEEKNQEINALQKDKNREINALQDELDGIKIELNEKIHVQAEKQLLQEEYNLLKDEFIIKAKALETTSAEKQQLELELQRLSDYSREAEKEYHQTRDRLNHLSQEKVSLEKALQQTKADLEEKDSHIKTAQQHIAKKVKEGALLSDELEKCQRRIHELQQGDIQHQIRIAELQASLDIHAGQEKRLQEQLSEVIKTYDSQIKKWEQKYFEIHDKWQATEIRKKELEKLEERHLQMQALLANIGSVLGNPIIAQPTFSSPSFQIQEEEKQSRILPEIMLESEKEEIKAEPFMESSPPKPYQDLFNMPKSTEKYRDTLF